MTAKVHKYIATVYIGIVWLLLTRELLLGIVLEAYAPIGSPGRYFRKDGDPDVLSDPVINEIAEKHNATPAQVASFN